MSSKLFPGVEVAVKFVPVDIQNYYVYLHVRQINGKAWIRKWDCVSSKLFPDVEVAVKFVPVDIQKCLSTCIRQP